MTNVTNWKINRTFDLIQIASKVLSAEIANRQHQKEKAIALLKEAIAIEDKLNYNEPPDWFFSVRHYLGKILLENGKYSEAEKIYLEDLKTLPENGFALIGLYNALQGQRKDAQAASVKKRFDKAWQYADMPISSSSNL